MLHIMLSIADFLVTVYESEDKKERDGVRVWAKNLGWNEKKIANKSILNMLEI